MNKFIRALIFSDFLMYFSYGLLTPIFAVFITEQISGGTLEVVGIATAVYWVVRSLATIPLGRWMDKHEGEQDEFTLMFTGSLLMSITLMALVWASLPWHIYIIQALFGLFNSMAIPGWRILFSNHLDRARQGYEWSVADVSVALATASAAYFGSVIAGKYGFNSLFVLVGLVGVAGSITLLAVRKQTHTLTELRRKHAEACNDLLESAGAMEKH